MLVQICFLYCLVHPFRQLRDLIICPRERGVVNYLEADGIVEQNLNEKDAVRQAPLFRDI